MTSKKKLKMDLQKASREDLIKEVLRLRKVTQDQMSQLVLKDLNLDEDPREDDIDPDIKKGCIVMIVLALITLAMTFSGVVLFILKHI